MTSFLGFKNINQKKKQLKINDKSVNWAPYGRGDTLSSRYHLRDAVCKVFNENSLNRYEAQIHFYKKRHSFGYSNSFSGIETGQ